MITRNQICRECKARPAMAGSRTRLCGGCYPAREKIARGLRRLRKQLGPRFLRHALDGRYPQPRI